MLEGHDRSREVIMPSRTAEFSALAERHNDANLVQTV
jgi:hypothetical protein